MVPVGDPIQYPGVPERAGRGRGQPGQVLGPDVEIQLHTFDETNTRVRPDRIISMIEKAGGRGLVVLRGRAVEPVSTRRRSRQVVPGRRSARSASAAPTFRAALPCCRNCRPRSLPPRSLEFRCSPAKQGGRRSLARRLCGHDGAALQSHGRPAGAGWGAAADPAPQQGPQGTRGTFSSLDLGRGCPYQCSFCTIINVQGRKSRLPHGRRPRAHSARGDRPGGQALFHHR